MKIENSRFPNGPPNPGLDPAYPRVLLQVSCGMPVARARHIQTSQATCECKRPGALASGVLRTIVLGDCPGQWESAGCRTGSLLISRAHGLDSGPELAPGLRGFAASLSGLRVTVWRTRPGIACQCLVPACAQAASGARATWLAGGDTPTPAKARAPGRLRPSACSQAAR